MAMEHISTDAMTPESSDCGSELVITENALDAPKNGIKPVERVPRDHGTPDRFTPDHSTNGHKTPDSHTRSNGSAYQPRYPRRVDRTNQVITAKNAQGFFDRSCSIFVGNISTKIELAKAEEGLIKTFSQFGRCWVKVKEGRQKALPGAFVVFDNPESAQKVIEHPGIVLEGRTLRVEAANCKRSAIIGHHSGEPITESDIAFALNSNTWGSIEKFTIEQSFDSGEPFVVARVTFAFLGDYEEAIKGHSDDTFYLRPIMESQGNQARRASNQMAPRGQRYNSNSNGYNNRPRGGRQFPPRGCNARNTYGGGNRFSNGYGNHQNFNGPASPNGYNGQGFANNEPPAGFPVNNFPNNVFPGHSYSNSGGFHQSQPANFQGYPNQGFPAPGPFPAAQPMIFNPQMQFQEGPPAPYFTNESFPPVYPFIAPNQPGFPPQALPQHMSQHIQLANMGSVPGTYMPPITTGPLIVSSQPIHDIQPHHHAPPYYPDSYMADNEYNGMQNDWYSPPDGYGFQHEYTQSQPIRNLPDLHRLVTGSRRSSSDSTTPSTPKEKGCERPRRQGPIIDTEIPRLIPVHDGDDGSSDLPPSQSGHTESEIITVEPLDEEKEDDMQTAVSEPIQSSRVTVVEVSAQDEEETPENSKPADKIKQLPTAAPKVEQVADWRGRIVRRSITPVRHEFKLMPIIPLHANRAAYEEEKAAILKPATTDSLNSTPTKTSAKSEASASNTINTPTKKTTNVEAFLSTTNTKTPAAKSPTSKAGSSASAATKTPTQPESKNVVALETPTEAEPLRSFPKYSATAGSWRLATPASMNHSSKSVPAPKLPSATTNIESQDLPAPKLPAAAEPGGKPFSSLPNKPPVPALARDHTKDKEQAQEDVKGKGKAPVTDQDNIDGKGKALKTEQEEPYEDTEGAAKAEVAENSSEPTLKTEEEPHDEEELRLEEELQMEALIRERFAKRAPLPQEFMPKEYGMEEMVMGFATGLEIDKEVVWLLAFIMEMEDEQRKKHANPDYASEEDACEQAPPSRL
ncbi:hypothetical protein PENANT_c031G07483 [Penicillium antarcticum]|uniref:RRM domain-containing protein n=1 Tax=Penicillium antarcticum TaxID=416450 RepID=A0A1V6PV13_9EURO|nr:uncharacterized protein N7508_005546 [Penicillium antarcticum]KAJ5306531.1 hypothetical protein N7508_005546 [Penicillium antarcticum]OQD80884.1 hypothetical protein PENANT_c031G07483 [Penicillium antarcticum]